MLKEKKIRQRAQEIVDKVLKETATRVLIEVTANTRRNIKVLASLEGQTMHEYLEWLIKQAYAAALHNRGRKVSVK